MKTNKIVFEKKAIQNESKTESIKSVRLKQMRVFQLNKIALKKTQQYLSFFFTTNNKIYLWIEDSIRFREEI